MPKQTLTLQGLKQELANQDAERDALVDKGRRAYRFGIEKRDCPERIESARALWVIGWERAQKEFEATNRR
jgi:ribosome modulation factor